MSLHPLSTPNSKPHNIVANIFSLLGIDLSTIAKQIPNGISSHSPITGEHLGTVSATPIEHIHKHIKSSHDAYLLWRTIPAPQRGELIRLFGNELRQHKEPLAKLVTLEAGKISQEGLGEVQEMIDICDFAVGLSRQLYGLTIASERPKHRMMETWHPLGVVGLITPFNFPVAVWAWNFTLSTVCGNSTVWKPSEKTPLTAIACHHLFEKALLNFTTAHKISEDLSPLLILLQGERAVTEHLIDHPLVPLVSATGSTEMGRAVGQRLAKRFAKSILELGGNNAMIVTPTADLELAVRAIAFSAVGTCGQRCTSLRRLFVHQTLAEKLTTRLKKIYENIAVGNPLDSQTLCGPLVDEASYNRMQKTLQQASKEGGTVFGGQRLLEETYPNAYYVRPALVIMPGQTEIVRTETFAPILYIMTYNTLEEAIALNNEVPQGLSSCIFTNHVQEAEYFLSSIGSDCGIANVNIGPSGAEIGGAFGGEKETGGGRESGSDAWRNYMRRATNTINYSQDLPLAQGIQFDVS